MSNERKLYKGNEIIIAGSEEKTTVTINDVNIDVEVIDKEHGLYTSPLVYGFYNSALELARAAIDVELGLQEEKKKFVISEPRIHSRAE